MTTADKGLYAAFAGLGATASGIPSVLPAAGRELGAPLLDAVPALFLGLLVGVLLSGPAMRLLRPAHAVAVGCLLQSGGLLVVAAATGPAVFVAAAALAGIGFGLSEAAGSVTAKLAAGTRSTTVRLSALTGTVAIAAALTPIVLLAGSAFVTPTSVLAAVAVVPLAAAVLLVVAERGRHDVRPTRPSAGRRVDLRRAAGVAPFAVALSVYVGVETVFAGWSAVLPATMLDIEPELAGLGTSAFWTLMAAGRYLAVVRAQRGDPASRLVLRGVVLGALALAVAAAASPWNQAVGLAAVAVAVVGIAPTYGVIAGLALDRLGDAAAADAMGVLVACGALGGVAVPVGVLFATADPASPLTLALCALLLLVVAAVLARAPTLTAPAGTPRRARPTTAGRGRSGRGRG